LLDENWEAKISDFGLSKVGPTNLSLSSIDASVKGTFGYLDPEYFYTSKVTRKTDVYAFGVVLFELLSGRLAVDDRYGEEQCSLVKWAKDCVKDQKLDQMVDSYIKVLEGVDKELAKLQHQSKPLDINENESNILQRIAESLYCINANRLKEERTKDGII
ncbi:receptor-like protein kinase FERONIA, partial [Tanacetum coccineum]